MNRKEDIKDDKGEAVGMMIVVKVKGNAGEKETDRVVGFHEGSAAGELGGLVRIEFGAMGQLQPLGDHPRSGPPAILVPPRAMVPARLAVALIINNLRQINGSKKTHRSTSIPKTPSAASRSFPRPGP